VSSDVLKRAKSLFGLAREPEPAMVPRKKAVQTHHAVGIVPGPRACSEVRKLVGQRFLSRDAPRLPLRDCGRPDCSCRYEHHEDRRRGPRRAREMGVAIDGYEGEEQREKLKRGRRKGDR
jgi:hypothetical protein